MHSEDTQRYLRAMERRLTRLEARLVKPAVRPYVLVALRRQRRALVANVQHARIVTWGGGPLGRGACAPTSVHPRQRAA